MAGISIVIATFNSEKFIKPCLNSIPPQCRDDFEIIVIDNGSQDRSVDFIKSNYPMVKLIENKENLGASAARNQGIKIAKGNWILTLDCDIILEKDFLKIGLDYIKTLGDSIGMVQPKILKTDRKTIYSCGIYFSRLGRFYDIGKGHADKGQFDKHKDIFGACSAAALYKRQMLDEIKENTGYFDERFFFLVEDVDLAYRANISGWKAMYQPEAVCYHYGNSSCLGRRARQYLSWRGRKFILQKSKMSKFNRAAIYSVYDFPRALLLFFTNPYVRNTILCKKNNLKL